MTKSKISKLSTSFSIIGSSVISVSAFAGSGHVARVAELVSNGKIVGVFEIVSSKKVNNEETTILKADDFQALNEIANPGDILRTKEASLIIEQIDNTIGVYSNPEDGTVGTYTSDAERTREKN